MIFSKIISTYSIISDRLNPILSIIFAIRMRFRNVLLLFIQQVRTSPRWSEVHSILSAYY